MYILKLLTFQHILFLIFSEQNTNLSPRTGPQDLSVTHYDCKENEQKTLQKYAINHVTQCESEPQAIETTNIEATLYPKARAKTLTGYIRLYIESIPFDTVNPNQIRNRNIKFRSIHNIENKLTGFQIYHETEFACKYRNPLHKTQYSEILVEYDEGFDMTTGKPKYNPHATHQPLNEGTSYSRVNLLKNAGNPRGKIKPRDTESTRLQELSLKKNTCFGAIHYDIYLDMKLDYTFNRIFQEMSLSELETLHQLCELERTEILQSLALAVLKIPYAGYLLSRNRSNFHDYEENFLWFYTCTKKISPLYVFEDKRCCKRITIFYKKKKHYINYGN